MTIYTSHLLELAHTIQYSTSYTAIHVDVALKACTDFKKKLKKFLVHVPPEKHGPL